MYSNKNITWSVESYIGDNSSAKNETDEFLCNFDKPESPDHTSQKRLNTNNSAFVFKWEDTNEKIESCGFDLEYTYYVAIKYNDTVIYSGNTTETNFTRELSTGEYTLELTTFNGFLNSTTSTSKLNFCYAEEIP